MGRSLTARAVRTDAGLDTIRLLARGCERAVWCARQRPHARQMECHSECALWTMYPASSWPMRAAANIFRQPRSHYGIDVNLVLLLQNAPTMRTSHQPCCNKYAAQSTCARAHRKHTKLTTTLASCNLQLLSMLRHTSTLAPIHLPTVKTLPPDPDPLTAERLNPDQASGRQPAT
jgi:hypothetical protein